MSQGGNSRNNQPAGFETWEFCTAARTLTKASRILVPTLKSVAALIRHFPGLHNSFGQGYSLFPAWLRTPIRTTSSSSAPVREYPGNSIGNSIHKK